MAGKTINPKEEFNKNRKILLSNLPPSTEGEIHEFLGSYRAKKISINDSLDSALVTLINGNQVEEAVGKLNNKQFKDNIVSVKPGLNGHLVSIAHIPLSYTDINFRDFCKKYGQVEYSYIMRAEDSGLSKGYGVVEFTAENEQVKQIKTEIDWHLLDGQTLHADFVPESYQSWDGLQSRCLLINNMPEDFVDVSKLREMFSAVTSPVYCQIIAKGDKSVGFGIIEYRTTEDAEKTWMKLKNEKINDKSVIITFCIPGKSAVVINNRFMWKYGDKLQKTSSLLPDPVSVKPVIAGNPIVISLTKHNPKLMEDFTSVLGELQHAYMSQMMSPENKPDGSCPFKTGLLGPAPSLPLSPMMNPNMQLGLLVMLALHIQATKKEQFIGVLAKQLNMLSEQEGIEHQKFGPKPSILGDPLTGQANVILASLKQQLNQVPLTGENGKQLEEPKTQDEKIRRLVKKFVTNGRYLNLGLLSNLGQLLVNMKHSDTSSHDSAIKGMSLLGPMPGSGPQLLMNTSLAKGTSLLGDPPAAGAQPLQSASIANANANINSSIMQAMGLNVGSGSSMGTMGQTLLSQISQGLVHQIGKNILYQMTVNQTGQGEPGRGLLGDVPKENNQKSKRATAQNKSLLGDAPQKSGQGTSNASTSLDQGTWKTMESRKKMAQQQAQVQAQAQENKNQMDRWGVGTYDNSGYDTKGGMGTTGNEYGYGNDAYGNMTGAGGQYAGYGDGTADYYNYQSQYGYSGQADNVYQTENSYNNQYTSGYGMAGNEGMNSNAGYGMNTGYEGNQTSGVNYQDGQVYGKEGSVGQDSGKYGTDGYGGDMSGAGYGYGCRNDSGNGYDSYDASGTYSGNAGNSEMGNSIAMGSGGMAGGYMGSAGMAGGYMGGGGVESGGMVGGGMGNGNGGAMGGSFVGSGGMDSGSVGGGGMGNSFMGSGEGSYMGNAGMNSGFMGSGGMGSRGAESGGVGSSSMGNSFMGGGGMDGSAMGSGGVGGGFMGNMGRDQRGSDNMGNSMMTAGAMAGNSMLGTGGMGGSNMMGAGGMGGSNMGGTGGMSGSNMMGTGGMGGSNMIGTGGMGGNNMMRAGYADNSGGVGGSGFMAGSGGIRGGGNMGGETMGNSSNTGGMADAYSTAGGMAGTGRSGMGSGGGSLLGNPGGSNFGGGMSSGSGSKGTPSGGMSGRESTAYFTGTDNSSANPGLLPAPSKYKSMPVQKRGLSQLMAQSEINGPGSSAYMDQQSQGHDGHYGDTFKKSRLY